MLSSPRFLVVARQTRNVRPTNYQRLATGQANRRSFASSSSHSQSQSQSYARSVLAWYSKLLTDQPILTKAITSGIIAGAGDWLCQYSMHIRDLRMHAQDMANEKQQQSTGTLQSGWQQDTIILRDDDDALWWDMARTGRFAFLGAVLVAPVIHYWYGLLATKWPSTAASSVAMRVAVDQFVFTPIYLPIWLTALWTLEATGGTTFSHDTLDNYIDMEQYDEKTDNLTDDKSPASTSISARLFSVTPPLILANWGYWIPVQFVNFTYMPVPYQVLFSNMASLLWTAYLSFFANDKQVSNRRDSQGEELMELPIV